MKNMTCPTTFHITNESLKRKNLLLNIQFNEAINRISQEQNTSSSCKMSPRFIISSNLKIKHNNRLKKQNQQRSNKSNALSLISVKYKDQVIYELPKHLSHEIIIQNHCFTPSLKLRKMTKRQKQKESNIKKKYLKTPNLQRDRFQQVSQTKIRLQQVHKLSVEQIMINRLKFQKIKDYKVANQPLKILCQYKRQMNKLKKDYDRLISK